MPTNKKKVRHQPQHDNLDDADNLGDYDAVKAVALDMLHGDGYWHSRIKRLFAGAGIETRRIEREEAHPVWQLWLTRLTFDLAPDNHTAVKQFRKILKTGGLKVLRDEFNIIDRRGNNLRCVFILDIGAPGVLQGRPRPAKKQGELWVEPR